LLINCVVFGNAKPAPLGEGTGGVKWKGQTKAKTMVMVRALHDFPGTGTQRFAEREKKDAID